MRMRADAGKSNHPTTRHQRGTAKDSGLGWLAFTPQVALSVGERLLVVLMPGRALRSQRPSRRLPARGFKSSVYRSTCLCFVGPACNVAPSFKSSPGSIVTAFPPCHLTATQLGQLPLVPPVFLSPAL